MTMQGEEMRALRRSCNLSQAELADAIGMSRETIGAMERGQAPIERRTELATRYVANQDAVALRPLATLHRHVHELFQTVIATENVARDDLGDLRIASSDWGLAEGGEVGDYLIDAALALFKAWRSTPVASRSERLRVLEEIRRLSTVWAVLTTPPA